MAEINKYNVSALAIDGSPGVSILGLDQIIAEALSLYNPDVSALHIDDIVLKILSQCNENIIATLKTNENARVTLSQQLFNALVSLQYIGKDDFSIVTDVVDQLMVFYKTSDNYYYKTNDGYLINFIYGRTGNI